MLWLLTALSFMAAAVLAQGADHWRDLADEAREPIYRLGLKDRSDGWRILSHLAFLSGICFGLAFLLERAI